MSDWENNEDEHEVSVPAVAVPKKKWDDEESDGDDSIPDEWDASDAEESEDDKAAAKPVAVAAKPVKKMTPEERWAERQAQRQAAKAEMMAAGGFDEGPSEDDGETKQMRDRRLQLEADASNVDNLFAGLTVKDSQTKDVLTALIPKTEAEFDELQTALVDRIQKSQSHRLYVQFLEKLIRELALPLKDVDMRKFSSTLTTLANEKQRMSREASKKKKTTNKKATVVTSTPKDKMDMNDYSNAYDDFDDFM